VPRTPAGPAGTTKKPSRSKTPSRPKKAGTDDLIRARRFDADRTDTELSFDDALAAKPSGRQLLWIDIAGGLEPASATALAKRFDLDERTRRSLEVPGDRPTFAIHGDYFHARVAAEPGDRDGSETAWLDIVAGKGEFVISRHVRPVRSLDDVDEQIEADASVGAIEPATFVAMLLGGVVTSYFRAVDAIEDEVDDLDARSLGRDDRHELLDDLVALRRRVARLRRVLTDHRAVFASLAETGTARLIDDPDAAAALLAVAARFDDAVAAVEDSREVLIGSFDVYMTRTAQRTNDIMKILAVTTVLLLPGSLVAGLLGMNVTVPLSKDDPISFWLVLVGVALLAVAIIAVAKMRRWL
jgi:magnesium transporter